MAARIEYKASVVRDLRKLGHAAAGRVLLKVERMLASEGHQGEALSGEFAGLYKLHVGDYRVIYARTEDRGGLYGVKTSSPSSAAILHSLMGVLFSGWYLLKSALVSTK